jgi:hypothetical protein
MSGDSGTPRPSLVRSLAHRLAGEALTLPVEGRLARFDGATAWLNSEPLIPEALRGRVVLVDFWTYTCVNWLRTAPYVRAWDGKYRQRGLTVVGAHTPEFGFEHDLDNVRANVKRLDVQFPVAVDNDYGVWQAFANHYWPAIYLADAEGRIRYHHFGEGEYAATEMAIQALLIEAGVEGIDQDLVMVDPKGIEVAADWRTLRSPETYVGYGQASGFAQEDVAAFGSRNTYSIVALRLNEWCLSGDWTVARHAGILEAPGGRIAFRFQARDANLVMGPPSKGSSIPFRVLLDGKPPTGSTGEDVDPDGRGTLDAQRTYQLIRQSGDIHERTIEIEFDGAGAEAYCFTFG